MLNFCSSFYKDIAYFGGYPSQMEFESLIDHGFKYFIDLTTIRERQKLTYDYSIDISNHKDVFYINYSIIDNNIPISKDSYMNFLSFLMKILKKKKRKSISTVKGVMVVQVSLLHLFFVFYSCIVLMKLFTKQNNVTRNVII